LLSRSLYRSLPIIACQNGSKWKGARTHAPSGQTKAICRFADAIRLVGPSSAPAARCCQILAELTAFHKRSVATLHALHEPGRSLPCLDGVVYWMKANPAAAVATVVFAAIQTPTSNTNIVLPVDAPHLGAHRALVYSHCQFLTAQFQEPHRKCKSTCSTFQRRQAECIM
jgi:hypothetical protein